MVAGVRRRGGGQTLSLGTTSEPQRETQPQHLLLDAADVGGDLKPHVDVDLAEKRKCILAALQSRATNYRHELPPQGGVHACKLKAKTRNKPTHCARVTRHELPPKAESARD